jgi:hypothetical protein
LTTVSKRYRAMSTTCDKCGIQRTNDDPWCHVRIGVGRYWSQPVMLSVRRLCPDCCLALGVAVPT